MAINNIMRAALKALSYPDIDIPKNYELERKFVNATHKHLLKPFYKTWDHKITCKSNNGVDAHEIPVRIFSPDGKSNHPIIIFFHGGGWVSGNIDTYDKVCNNMAKITNRVVVSVDYLLAPEHPFPAGLEDCYAVVRDIYLNLDLLNTSPNEIALMGDSAGGNLAAAVSLLARDRGEFSVRNQILIYPSTYNDHSEKSRFKSIKENGTDFLLTSKKIRDYMRLYRNHDYDINNQYVAPLLAKDFSNQPKTLVITAEYDPLRDEGQEYAYCLQDADNYVEQYCIPDALHGFFSLPSSFTQVRDAYDIINQFLDEVTY